MRPPGPREQEAQVIVDLGYGANGRPRVAACALLVDRDRRREALDVVDVRLLHLAEELAGIGRERLDITALALGIDRVEGKRALPRAGQPGDNNQAVAGNGDVYIL